MIRRSLQTFNNSKFILIFLFILLVFLRIPSLFEPTWYGDEGIYAAVAHGMNQGQLLYSETWDNKTPGIYYIYSTLFQLFGPNQFYIRLLSLIFILISFYFFYKSFRILFKEKNFFLPGFIFVFLWGIPFFESNIANGENFFILFSSIGLYCLLKFLYEGYKVSDLWLMGFIFGLGFIIKIHPVFEFAFAMITLLSVFVVNHHKRFWHIKNFFNKYTLIPILAFLIPLALYILTSAIQGNLNDFLHMFFSQSGTYIFDFQYDSIGFVILPSNIYTRSIVLIIAIGILMYLYFKKHINEKSFILISFFLFASYAVLFSGRPYPHYLLQLIIPFALLVYYWYSNISHIPLLQKINYSLLSLLTIFLILSLFYSGRSVSGYRVLPYYGNFTQYILGIESKEEYNDYFDTNVNKLLTLTDNAKFLKGKRVFLLDNNPWFYPLSDSINPTKYVALYHLGQDRVNYSDFANDLPVKYKVQYLIENTERLDIIPPEFRNVIKNNYTYIQNVGIFNIYRLNGATDLN